MRVLLDTCVLYPPSVRDFVLGLATEDAFEIRISAGVLEELEDVLGRRAGMSRTDAAARVAAVTAVADVLGAIVASGRHDDVIGRTLDLPDDGDAHLVDAALASDCDAILTFNLDDLPEPLLETVGLEAWHPDLVLEELAQQRHPGLVRVASDLLRRIRVYDRPADIAIALGNAGLPHTGGHLLAAGFAVAVEAYREAAAAGEPGDD